MSDESAPASLEEAQELLRTLHSVTQWTNQWLSNVEEYLLDPDRRGQIFTAESLAWSTLYLVEKGRSQTEALAKRQYVAEAEASAASAAESTFNAEPYKWER